MNLHPASNMPWLQRAEYTAPTPEGHSAVSVEQTALIPIHPRKAECFAAGPASVYQPGQSTSAFCHVSPATEQRKACVLMSLNPFLFQSDLHCRAYPLRPTDPGALFLNSTAPPGGSSYRDYGTSHYSPLSVTAHDTERIDSNVHHTHTPLDKLPANPCPSTTIEMQDRPVHYSGLQHRAKPTSLALYNALSSDVISNVKELPRGRQSLRGEIQSTTMATSQPFY